MLAIFRILLALALVAGVGLGSFYLVRAIEDTGPEQALVASPTATTTATVAALPTDTPEPTATTAPPSPTAPAALPTALPTKIPLQPRRDLPTAAEIMVDANGKYFIPDRGDGCPWFEHTRGTIALADPKGATFTEVIFTTPCDADFSWVYRVETGELIPMSP